MVARGAAECDDRICFALWARAIIACDWGSDESSWHWSSESECPTRTVVKFVSVPLRWRSHCPLHRKREPQHHASSSKTLRDQLLCWSRPVRHTRRRR